MSMKMNNKKKEMTLLQAIERVVELSNDSKMSPEFMKKAKAEIQLLAKSYGITERQAVLFCICMEKGPNRVDYSDIASHLDMNKISVLSYASDIDNPLEILTSYGYEERIQTQTGRKIGFDSSY